MKAISVDLGGSHVTVAIVEEKNILISREISVNSAAGLSPLLPVLKTMISEMLSKTGLHAKDCIGLAMCICAMTERDHVVGTNGKFEDAPSIDLPAWGQTEFGIPLVLENDARMALVGEWFAGAAQGVEDVVMMTLGTGVGGAAMAGGKVYRTKQVQGGCLGGHIPVLFTGRKCTCGSFGCMEAEASGWALPLIAKDWPGFACSRLAHTEKINFRALFELAEIGDRVSTEIRDRCLQVWACGTVGLIHVYGPERVIIGGGVMRSGHTIIPYIQNYADNFSWTPSSKVQVMPAALGNDAALLGAMPLLTGVVS